MDINNQKIRSTALKAGKVGARSVKDIVVTVFRIIFTVLLVAITTCAIFACIFVIYIKTNLTADLDISLEDFTLNQTSTVYYTNAAGNDVELIKLQGKETRTWIDYEEIPKDVEHAVVAIEDKRFYEHHGVDWYRTVAAFVNMFLSNNDNFGGSTITQQLIKNITEYNDVTVQRKLYEIFRALELEKNYTKDEIMEWYLNAVYFGHGNYGIAAAADYYYGKEVDELTLAEIASIIGITNNPSMYSPFMNPDKNKTRQEYILNEMCDQGYITREECDAACDEELMLDTGDDEEEEEEEETGSAYYSYFIDALIEDVIADIQEEKSVSYKTAEQLLFNSGYKIYATINLEYQNKVDEIFEDESNFTNSAGSVIQSAAVVTDPYTGNVLALSGGVGEKENNRVLNRATGTTRPPGSSFKPVATYGPAMDLGLITPNTRFNDAPGVKLTGTDWYPNNISRSYSGVVTVRQAIVDSLNTIAAQVMDILTPQRSYEFLTEKLHFSTLVYERGNVTDVAYAPLALGQLSDGVTVREMAAAYSIFVNNGIYTEARTYTRIEDSNGNLVFDNQPISNVAISDVTAYWMTSMLQDVCNYGGGSSARISGMPCAGKTGTSSSSFDRWFAGYTPYYVCVVWTGYDTPRLINFSGNPSAKTWHKIMGPIHENLEYKKFNVPSNTYLTPIPGVEFEEEELPEEELPPEELPPDNPPDGGGNGGQSHVVPPTPPDNPDNPDNPDTPDNPDNPDDNTGGHQGAHIIIGGR